MLKICKINACPTGTLGLHLSRAPWDPYPWVSGIQEGSSAEEAGMRVGDTVLEFNGNDVLGQKIFEIATKIREHWQSGATDVKVVIWRNETEADSCCSDANDEEEADDSAAEEHLANSSDSETAAVTVDGRRKRAHQHEHQHQHQHQRQQHSSINQQSLQKFATCLQHIAQLLECPVCLEVIRPPGWQCCNGHVLCNNCRSRSVKCPVCRVPLGPRGRCLLADKLFTVLAESFPCDGVRSDRNSPKEQRKCSPELKAHPKASTPIRQQQGQKNQQHQQQQKQKIIAKEMQQQDKKKVKTAAGSQKNVTNEKVVVKECTATTTPVAGEQQINNTTDNSNSSKKKSPKVEGTADGNLLHGCHWQWRTSRARLDKAEQHQQQQQQQHKSSEVLQVQVYKGYADDQLSVTASSEALTMRTADVSS